MEIAAASGDLDLLFIIDDLRFTIEILRFAQNDKSGEFGGVGVCSCLLVLGSYNRPFVNQNSRMTVLMEKC